jgi:hypothetical protein
LFVFCMLRAFWRCHLGGVLEFSVFCTTSGWAFTFCGGREEMALTINEFDDFDILCEIQ